MPVLNINDLGVVGLNKDLQPHHLPVWAWSDALNVRFREDAVEKLSGYMEILGTPTVAPVFGLSFVDDNVPQWIYTDGTKAYRIVGQNHLEVTNTDNDYNTDEMSQWSGGVFNGVPIINNNSNGFVPQQWDTSISKLRDLENWPEPEELRCLVMRPFKNFLVAYGLLKPDGPFLSSLRWSHVADPGTVPTSWDITDPTLDAGEVSLAESPGRIVDALPLGDINYIYKEDSVWGMQFVGGQSIFRFFQVMPQIGALSVNCVKAFKKFHFVVTQDDVVIHNGQSPESVIDKRNRRYLFNDLNIETRQRTFVSANYRENEMWICYPSSGSTSGYADKAMIWNWEDNTWSIRTLPEISFMDTGFVGTVEPPEVWDNITLLWNNNFNRWDDIAFEVRDQFQMMASPRDNKFYFVGIGNTENGVPMFSTVERRGLTIAGQDLKGNLTVDQTNRKFVRSLYPRMDGNGPVNFFIGSQNNIQDAVDWSGPYAFDPRTDERLDFRVNGRFIAVRIEATTDIFWRLYDIQLDLDVISEARR